MFIVNVASVIILIFTFRVKIIKDTARDTNINLILHHTILTHFNCILYVYTIDLFSIIHSYFT